MNLYFCISEEKTSLSGDEGQDTDSQITFHYTDRIKLLLTLTNNYSSIIPFIHSRPHTHLRIGARAGCPNTTV